MDIIYKDNFIKIDNDNVINLIVPAMHKYVNTAYHNKSAHINCICYALNTLSKQLHEDNSLEELTLEYDKQAICNMLGVDVIHNTENRVYKSQYDNAVGQLILNSMYVLQSINGPVNTYMPIFDRVIYDSDSSVVTMEFNKKFIKHIKACRDLTTGYTNLYVDMCVSLSTMNAKIVWAILCKYESQMKQYGATNPTKVVHLLKHLSPYKVVNNKVVYTMRNSDLVITVNRAIAEINNLLVAKASNDNKSVIKGYAVEWEYDENGGMTNNKGKLLRFSFSKIDLQVIKEIKPKSKTIKEVFSPVKKTAEPKQPNYNTEIKEIIDYLNLKADTKFRYNTKDTIKHINARLKEGYTIDDFKYVIDVKVSQWKDDATMCGYIRPQTLFGIKMESYVNEKIKYDVKDHHHNNKSSSWDDWMNGPTNRTL